MPKTALLTAVNAKYVHSSLAVWYLSEAIRKFCKSSVSVTAFETSINSEIADIESGIQAENPDFICLPCCIWNASVILKLLESLKDTSAVIILGGPEASHNAEFWLQNGADYVIKGEGELALPKLIDALCSERVFSGIEGLCRIENGIYTENPQGKPLTALINPYSADYFKALNGKIAYIETSRGCPFSCAYCLSGDSETRFFPVEAAAERLLRLIESGTRTIKFVDRTFNCNPSRAMQIFEFVIGLKSDCSFHFEVAADLFTEPELELLSTAPHGRIQLEAGLQSFYKPALEAVSRKTNLEKAASNIRYLLKKGNIRIHADLIAGLPYETLSEFENSFNKAFELKPHALQLGFLKLLHGSVLRMRAKDFGISFDPAPPYEVTQTAWLSTQDIKILKTAENALQHTYNKGRFRLTLEYVLNAVNLSPFKLFQTIGGAVPHNSEPLQDYAASLFTLLQTLPGVNTEILKDMMASDYLSMSRGRNMPHVLKRKTSKNLTALIADHLGKKPGRDEVIQFSNGSCVFVKSADRDSISGLYTLGYADLL